jgi:uncharacterized membrane protein
MKPMFPFVRTSLVGGLLVLAPLYLLVLLLARALAGALKLVAPITQAMPVPAALQLPAAIGVMLLACFLAGVAVQTGPGARMIYRFQHRLLEKIPGYTILRTLVARLSGTGDAGEAMTAALVEIEEALVPALVVEKLPDDEYVVMVPSVPTPLAGALYVLPAARVHHIDLPLTRLLQIYAKWGEGTGEMVAKLKARRAAALA